MTSYEKGICECFERKDAEFIARELNILQNSRNFKKSEIIAKVKAAEVPQKGLAEHEKTVTIPAREHNELSYAATLLQALKDFGVEDWDGWESAIETAEENHDGEIPYE
jgi:hypothetical protein